MHPENYKYALTVDAIKDYIGNSSVIAFDFETAPDEAYRTEKNAALDSTKSHIVGCSLSVKEGTGIYVPFAHRKGKNASKEAIAFIWKLLMNKQIKKIAHNVAFEAAFAYAKGIVIQPPVYDTICAAQLTLKSQTEFRKLSDSGLKNLTENLLHEHALTFDEVTKGLNFDELDGTDEKTVKYACADSDNALSLYRIFSEWFNRFLPKHKCIVEEIESPAAVYTGIMKHTGTPIDLGLMKEKSCEAEQKISDIRKKIHAITGDIDIGSNCATKAFKKYLYEEQNLPILKSTETNRAAANDMAMALLKEWCGINRPDFPNLFEPVQEYRKWTKIKTTYIDGYAKYINPSTNRIHPDFFLLSTDTGRMSCRNPNMQNMPRKTNDPIGIRNIIRAPCGHLILSVDFSQIELRVGAYYCRDNAMLDVYKNNGDIHAATTSAIFGITYEEAQDKSSENYKERRTIAKNVNFGTFYGLYPKGLQKTLKFKAGINKSIDECEIILSNLKRGYPRLQEWQESAKAAAKRKMYVETLFGRRRYLPGIVSNDWNERAYAERCALNTPIQGTAADILKLAMARILSGLAQRPWLKPIMQIHDELAFIIPKDRLNEAVAYVCACMEQKPFPEFDIPLIAKASAGETFGTMEDLN